MKHRRTIVVVGGYAVAVTLVVDRPAAVGETLRANGQSIGHGGKGSNQAVACARLGAAVEFLTCLGNDRFGREARELYRREGVGGRWIAGIESMPTGLEARLVTPGARNAVVADIGAGRQMDGTFIDERRAVFDDATVLVGVAEAPLPAVERAIETAHSRGVRTILDPDPAVTIPRALLPMITVLTPNSLELAALTAMETGSLVAAGAAAEELRRQGAEAVVVTMGEKGALLCHAGGLEHVFAPAVEAVDTAGAGDAFTAGFAVALSEGLGFAECTRFAVRCGSLACTGPGVIPSLPFRASVDETPRPQSEGRGDE